MDHIGIDVHKKESQICILAEGGELIEQRVRTEPRCFAETLGGRPRVVVADPNFAPTYATRIRKVKADRRAARALAEACLLGAYRPAHRLSDAQCHCPPGRGTSR